MLSVLTIHNIAIIESAEIEFSRGLHVLTGETGAGKSIILDSIGAVLGYRTSRELIRTGEKSAEVTALFTGVRKEVLALLDELGLPQSGDGSVLISRSLTADRGVCRVNGAVTTVGVLRQIGDELILIHGQQDNRELLDEGVHLTTLDAMARDGDELAAFASAYRAYLEKRDKLRKLSEGRDALEREADMLSFRIDELEKADIHPGEWDKLRERFREMENFEKLQTTYAAASQALGGGDEFGGATSLTSDACREMKGIADCSAKAKELAERLESVYYELNDVADTIGGLCEGEGFTEAERESVQNRLDLLLRLSRKYGATEEEMLATLDEARRQREDISFSDEKLEQLRAETEDALKAAEKAAATLSERRHQAAVGFTERVTKELLDLDMPNVRFEVRFGTCDLCENGVDTVAFLISANVGEEPKPLAKIASGGELSRIMLAIKTVTADRDKTETVIFDEIDAGISGRAADRVAHKLSRVADGRQVICVTHLAQIAAFADAHYQIAKTTRDGKTYTNVTPLDDDGRARELARITGGVEPTETQLRGARELLARAKEEKQ